jgi:beta-glucosidase
MGLMNSRRILALLLSTIGVTLAQSPSPEQRAAELVAKMTLAEKVTQMQNAAPAIPRLKIPEYDWWNEALHGVARSGLATVFPQAIGLAATWDTDLEQRIADVISTEARAKYNYALRHDNHARYYGLTFWSPNINIVRDPRWGRGQETYGEDPYLTSQLALAFIHGLQGDDPHYLKSIATPKHFAVHSGPEVSRHQFDAKVSQEDLDNTYLYAFHKALGPDGAYSAMCSYNRVNGEPACASPFLLEETLRKNWNFSGYVVSDCGAVGDVFEGHHSARSMAEGAAKAVKAGTDLTCGNEYKTLPEAVAKSFITEKEIDRAVTRLFVARFRLGMFDPPEQVPFSKIGMDEVASAAHQQVALEAAEKSIVLLKNESHTLPLETIPHTIAVLGPAADDPDVLLGNYYGTPSHIVTPLTGIKTKFGARAHVQWALGSVYANTSTALVPPAALPEGVSAEYFNNDDFSGEPGLKRVEPRGYFVWAMHDPAVANAIPEPTFAVRWTATLQVQNSGEYELGLARQECDSCPGVNKWRLSIDGKTRIDETRKAAGGSRTARFPIHLDKGKAYQIKVEYVQQKNGSGVELVWAPPSDRLLREAVDLVKQSDLAVLCIGLNSRLEGEESPIQIPGFAHGDRTDIELPEQQKRLLEGVLDTGKPTVVVLVNGSALAINMAKERAQAILEVWYGGQEGGTAIARTLSGDNNPGGRLPVTFYQSVNQLPEFDDYSMKERTYRYFNGTPLFPFGYGLSYSEFHYSDLKVTRQEATVNVTNRSQRAGDEVVQLYRSRELKGFTRIHLLPSETKVVRFMLANIDGQGDSIRIGGLQGTLGQR